MIKGFDNIDHVVVVMMENRSFDNLLGWLYADVQNQPPINIPPQAPTVRRGRNTIGSVTLRLVLFLVTCGVVCSEVAAESPPRRTVYAWFPADVNNFDTAAINWTALTH